MSFADTGARTARPLDDTSDSGGRAALSRPAVVRAPVLRWDRFGFFASSLCAVHCLCLPWLLIAMPFLAGTLLADREAERWFVAGSIFLATACTIGGCRAHGKWWLVGLVTTGAVALVWGHATAPPFCCAKDLSLSNVLATSMGGALLATTHFLNLRSQSALAATTAGACCNRSTCSNNRS